jgi:hypothetical protein
MGFRPSPFAAIFAVGVVATAVILLHLSIKPNEPPHLAPSGPVTQQVRRAQAPSRSPVPPGVPTVLILSPMKGAAKYLDGFFENLRKLTHPHAAISLGFLHSGGAVAADGMSPNSSTWRRYGLPSVGSFNAWFVSLRHVADCMKKYRCYNKNFVEFKCSTKTTCFTIMKPIQTAAMPGNSY